MRWGILSLTAALAAGTASSAVPVQWNARVFETPKTSPAPAKFAEAGLSAVLVDGLDCRGQATRFFAYYGVPAAADGRPVPGMVLVHGGGGTAFAEWVRLWNRRGYAAIAMDTTGTMPCRVKGDWERLPGGGPVGEGRLHDWRNALGPVEDQWAYQAVADVILSHSLLRSLPGVDPERIGITGISWGSFLTMLTAAVDRRLKFAAPVYGCAFYDTFTPYMASLKAHPAETRRWLELWDPKHYVPEIAAPILWATGTNDIVFEFGSWQRMLALAKSEPCLAVRVPMAHNHFPDGVAVPEIAAFADSILRGGRALARVGAIQMRGGVASAAVQASGRALKRAELVYTEDDQGPWRLRRWQRAAARLTAGRVEAEVPATASSVFFNVTDTEGLIATSPAVLKPDRPLGDTLRLSHSGGLYSLPPALTMVREMRAAGVFGTNQVITLKLTPGVYYYDKPIRLGPEDSNLRIVGDGGEAVLEFGLPLRFSARADGVWTAPVPKRREVRLLFVNGRRAVNAREPNAFYHYLREEATDSKRAFYGDREDLAKLAATPADERQDVLFTFWQSWDNGLARLRDYDEASGLVSLATNMQYSLFKWSRTRPRYTYENCRAAFDAPGEWFWDKKAQVILYRPRPGEKLESTTAYSATVEKAIQLDRCRNVVWENLAVEHTLWDMSREGSKNYQAGFQVKAAAISAANVEGVVLRNCRVAHTGAHGIWFGKGCRDCLIEHTLVEDTGAGGIYIGEDCWHGRRRDTFAERITVRDSIVRHGGRTLEGGVGVLVAHARDTSVVHNDIYDFNYTGVSVGWTWGYHDTPNCNNHVDFNRIHHIGQGRLSDLAAVYTLGKSPGSTVCRNWVWAVNGYRDNGSPAWGLYADEGSTGYLFASNLVADCRSGALQQHFGEENVFENNLCVNFGVAALNRSRSEDHITLRMLRNIFYWTDPQAICVRGGGTESELTNIVAEANLYWPAGTGGVLKRPAFKGLDWEGWRRQGHDREALIADPKFVDPAKGDWRLKPDSPALRLGFKEFDWTEAGVFKRDAAWRARAEEVTWEKFEDAPTAPMMKREHGRVDFENCKPGATAVAAMNNLLVPFQPYTTVVSAMTATAEDPGEGRVAMVMREVAGLKAGYEPLLSSSMFVDGGKLRLRASVKPLTDGCNLNLACRDTWNQSAGLSNAQIQLVLRRDAWFFDDRRVAAAPIGKWTEVELTLDFSTRTWHFESRTRGGEPEMFDGQLPKKFAIATWYGIFSTGDRDSAVALDAVDFKKE